MDDGARPCPRTALGCFGTGMTIVGAIEAGRGKPDDVDGVRPGSFEGEVERVEAPLLVLRLLPVCGTGGALLCEDVDSPSSLARLLAGADRDILDPGRTAGVTPPLVARSSLSRLEPPW